MPLFPQLITLFSRPLLIPASIAGIGLWYGSYDLTYQICRVPLFYTRKNKKQTIPRGIFRSFITFSVGTSILSVRYFYAPKGNSVSVDYKSIIKTIESLRNVLPVRYHVTSVCLSGVVTGVSMVIYDEMVFP